ncbi:glycosyltransferase family 8 protein [Devosia sp. 2618]|uniref:glycosyltransferase family 8 protein n=1 Tax=Devosia sp. 2618 TaxID=3156454 RepID=UPI003390BE28
MTVAARAAAHPYSSPSGLLEIALTFDDNFWAPAYATMRSICLTSPNPAGIRFHVIHTTLRDDHLKAIESIGTEYGAQLKFTDLDKLGILRDRVASFPKVNDKRLNPIVYARLFLGDLLDASIDRVLFLDCDIFVRARLDPLFGMDMEGFAIAAVQQPDRLHSVAGRDLTEKPTLSLADPYFNAGIMLIDLNQYRQMDFVSTLTQNLTQAEIERFYYDQDIINFCFRGRFLELDVRWNLQNPIIAHEAFNPHILHYSTGKKPWLAMSDVAFKRTYRHLMTNQYYYQYRRERLERMVRGWFKRK